jgi:curli biogenesis system outer membrane secretion channel CsgG
MCTILFRLWRKALIALLTIIVVGCATTATVQSGEDIQKELELPEYNGPKAPVAVGPCEDKTGGRGEFTVETSEGQTEVSVDGEIGDGMKDMLVTALVNSGRFQVLESNAAVMEAMEREQQIQDITETQRQMQAAELVVTCPVTSFEPRASGGEGGVVNLVGGSLVGGALAAVAGGTKKSTTTLDFRLVDTDTRAILGAFNVQGEASDFSLGAGALSAFGPGARLGVFSNAPIEKAVRIAILKAVGEIAIETPREYFGNGSRATSTSSGRMQQPSPDSSKVSPGSEPKDDTTSAADTSGTDTSQSRERPGDGGDDVEWVQKTLNDLGYDCGSEDGVMGPNTRSCIRSFQEANDLEVTGKVNEATYQMMLVKL